TKRRVWLTEATWPAGKGRLSRPQASWQRNWWTTDAGMAKRVRSIYSLVNKKRRELRLGRVYWYTWSSAYAADDLFDYTGLVRFSGGEYEQRPALKAFAASARRHQGCRKSAAGVCD
ncbi:MAG: polysaccharide biosynthesis protein PslG, partial [Thermoleophilaceae bacterium]|nr:polysaccharide biosynthesis protein PslG [Thermoleophilaceae bacterium]